MLHLYLEVNCFSNPLPIVFFHDWIRKWLGNDIIGNGIEYDIFNKFNHNELFLMYNELNELNKKYSNENNS